MRILLINPPLENEITSWNPQFLDQERGHNPPLGLLYLAGYLKSKEGSHQIKIIDAPTEKLSYPQLREKIREFDPELTGITAMSFTLIDALKTAQIAKEINPQTKVVMGGPHIHIYGKETLKIGNSDFMVLGEGEETFYQLIKNLGNEEKLKTIPGLIFYDKNRNLISTGAPRFIENLNEIPFPARDLVNNKKYFSLLGESNLVTTMITSRGCPYKCLFCDRPHLGKIFRARSPQNVVEEMEECEKEYGIKEFLIYDDTFTIDRQRVIDICNEIIRRKLDIIWDIRARVNTVDKEMLKLLRKAGCVRIHYGVEAGTQKILNVLRKGITLEQAEKAFQLTRQAGIQTLAYFMIGNPGETKEDILKTIEFSKKLKPDYVHITTLMPFPATDLYYLALKEGIIKSDVWLEFAQNPSPSFNPPLWEENLSREELYDLIKKTYKEFYFRPAYILKRILALRSLGEFKRKAKAGLKIWQI